MRSRLSKSGPWYATCCLIQSLAVWKPGDRKVDIFHGPKLRYATLNVGHAVICLASLRSRVQTGQRISDLVRMGWTDIESFKGQDGINVTQYKTGRQVWVPIFEELAAAMPTWEKQPGPFLRRLDGGLWKSKNLTLAWRHEKDRNEQLAEHKSLGLVLHGLRGHCCVRLSRAGLSDHQISDIVGMSIPMVGRYTRLSAQKENALAAVISLSRHKSLKYKGA